MKNKIDSFTQSYIIAALWSSTDDCDNPLDSHFGIEDIKSEMIDLIAQDCEQFQEDNFELLNQAYDTVGYTIESAGHDFWLTRNGHGVGFWDRNLDDVGDKLTAKCKELGGSDCYIGDDNKIYFTNTPTIKQTPKTKL